VKLIDLKTNNDSRGSLTAIEEALDIPFEIRRCYLLHHLEAARGGHAHRDTQQLVIAASGSIRISLSDRTMSRSFILDAPARGLLINPMTWIEIPEFSLGAVVVVLASTHYRHDRTLRDLDLFLSEVRAGEREG
jgi:dTDP-4-dehydrorhamnose 3,5-epimerase-like enzyme